MNVIGGQDGRSGFAGDAHQFRKALFLFLHAVVLQFHKDVVLPEDIFQGQQGFFRLFRLVVEQPFIEGPGKARRAADEALMEFPQGFHVHARLVVEAFQMGAGDHLDQVLPARFIFRQKKKVCVFAPAGKLLFHADGRGGEVHFTAEDRLHGLFPWAFRVFLVPGFRGFVEAVGLHDQLNGSKEVAVIRDGDGGHSHAGAFRNEVLDVDGAVQKGVFRVVVEVYEGVRHESGSVQGEGFRSLRGIPPSWLPHIPGSGWGPGR